VNVVGLPPPSLRLTGKVKMLRPGTSKILSTSNGMSPAWGKPGPSVLEMLTGPRPGAVAVL